MSTFEPSSCIEPTTKQLGWNSSYLGIPRPLLRHPSFSSLKGNAVKLLLAMGSGYIGNNNGELIATFPVMKKYGFNSKDAIAKALSELLQAGMIIRTRRSDYKRAATYAVTWLPVNQPGARGPYDAGVAPSDVAEDRWRDATPHSTPGASAQTAPAVAASAPSCPAASAPASAPVAAPAVATHGATSPQVTGSVTPSTSAPLAQKQPHVSPEQAKWREIKARRDREAAEKRFYEDRSVKKQSESVSHASDPELEKALAELVALCA